MDIKITSVIFYINIENNGIKFLCFSKLKYIKKLDLSLNGAESISARHFINGQINYINELCLFSNYLLSVGVQFLMNWKFIPNLKILDLSCNDIGNEGCIYIAKGINFPHHNLLPLQFHFQYFHQIFHFYFHY